MSVSVSKSEDGLYARPGSGNRAEGTKLPRITVNRSA